MAGTSYTRQSTIADGNIITAALFNNEFNQILNAFAYATSGTTGHSHDGSAGQGAAISKIGDQDFKNKIECNSTDNRLEFSLEVGGASVEQIRIQDGAIVPVTDSDIDLGTNSVRFKDLYVDSISVGSHTIGTTTTFNDDVVFAGAASPGSKITFDKSLTALHFADNVKASFGGTSANPGDLIIFHDGSNSYIQDLGTGDLYVRGDASVHVGGNTSAPAITTTTGGVTFRAGNTTQAAVDTTGITLADDKIVSFGDDKDLKIYHDGTNSYIQDGGTGDLIIVAFDQIKMTQTTGVGSFPVAEFGISTGCELFHNTSKKFNTTSTGVTITGNTSISGSATAQTFNANAAIDTPTLEVTTLKSRDATTAGTIADSTGIVTLNSSVLTTTDINGGTIDGVTINGAVGSSHLTFADNHKAIFGNDGNELALYHNASDSIIEDQGTGSLLIKGTQLKLQSADGEDYATFTNNGPARLFNNGVEKFATSSTGATVTGRLNTGQIEVTTLRANDGTSAGSIADSTGVVTLASSVLTTADINGGTVDNVVIGGSTAAAGNFTTLGATGLISGTDLTLTDSTPRIQFNDSDGTNQKTEQVQVGGSFVTTVRNNTSHGSIDFKSNNGTNNLLRFRVATDGDFNFYENNGSTVGVKWDAPNGRLGIGTTSPSQKLHVDGKIITTEGIYLGGTGGANLLDDYEEGTWTPVMRDATSGGNVAGAANLSGVYTKIGRHVNLTIRVINVSNTGMTSSNDIYITGLPFAATDLSPSFRHIGSVESTRIDYGSSIQSRITENTSYIMLSSSTNVGGLGTLNWSAMDADESGSGVADLFITHTYIAD